MKGKKMKILFPLLLVIFLISCSNDSQNTSKTSSAKEEILEQVNETAKVVSKSSEEVVKQVQKSADVVVKQVKVSTSESVQKLKKSSAKVVSEVAHKTAEVAKEVEVQAKEIAKSLEVIDGSKLFAKCAGCHGADGERKALGKSQIIQAWSVDKTIAALNGYKDGSYGGSMKGVMKSQISKLSDAEINALATYISGL